VIASKRRFATLRESLLARGVPRATVDGIAAPAGLDIGARTPEEIALSVLAQIIALRTRVEAAARETPGGLGEAMRRRMQETPLQEGARTDAATAHAAATNGDAGPPAPRRFAPAREATAGALDESLDPVCGMTVAVTGALHFADVAGGRFYFCCSGCRQMFLADPARYTSAAPHGRA
jgi:xanthine dehydrogenase accessory factor